MAWLSRDRLAISTWLPYEVHILEGVTANDPSKVKVVKFALNLDRPQGLTAIGDDIYISDRTNVRKLTDANGDGKAEITNVTKAYSQTKGHPFSYGMLNKDGFLYYFFGGYAGPASEKGSFIKMNLAGKREALATGFRNPNGIGFGPDGEMFASDNQGEWLPANKLIHIQAGRFYGFRTATTPATAVESPPAIYIPHGDAGRSPSQPIYIGSRPGWERYAGQMLMGDVIYGNVDRIFLEKINGEYQGALFHFTGGLDAGINRMLWGSDNALYLGGVGDNSTAGWNWKSRTSCLHRMVPNSDPVFEMLAIRARKGGFEIEFSEPVGPAAESTSNYRLKMWWYKPDSSYGGPQMDPTNLTAQSVRLSSDRKKVFLEVPGLVEKRVVYIRIHPNIKSQSDRAAPTTEAWYTLNALGVDEFPTAAGKETGYAKPGLTLQGNGGSRPRISWAWEGDYSLEIRDITGKIQARVSGHGPGGYSLEGARYGLGLYFATLKAGAAELHQRILLGKDM
jgi:cytochrome c